MKKRLISLFLIACVVLAAGCSSGNKDNKKSETVTAGGSTTEIEAVATTTAVTDSSNVSSSLNSNSSTSTKKAGGNNSATTTQKTTIYQQITFPPTTAPKKPGPLSAEMKQKLGVDKKSIDSTLVSPITGDTYKLKFIDDFSGTQLNMNNWSYYTRNYNASEEQVNRKENVSVKDGSLIIKALKENKTYTGDAESWETPKTSKLTGGAINSLGKKSFKYGKIEMYAKLPYSLGMWPAFWTMGTGRGWPWGGEIDIMELVGGVDQWGNYRDDEYSSALHYAAPEATAPDAYGKDAKHLGAGKFKIPNGKALNAKMNDNWYVIGMEWTNKSIIMYCNGQKTGETSITDPDMREAFHLNHYLILNLVMGGSWAGTPNEKTVFPQEFKVDWVKVWQKG